MGPLLSESLDAASILHTPVSFWWERTSSQPKLTPPCHDWSAVFVIVQARDYMYE
jgi:hypothetical protein